jgi:hypothetical protein
LDGIWLQLIPQVFEMSLAVGTSPFEVLQSTILTIAVDPNGLLTLWSRTNKGGEHQGVNLVSPMSAGIKRQNYLQLPPAGYRRL